MQASNRHPSLVRRAFSLAALVALLVLAGTTLVQCRAVDQTITGVDVSTSTGTMHGKHSDHRMR
jgi:hypothetical protein